MKVIIIDTETTGLVEPEAIEVAYCSVDGDFVEFIQRYQPSKPISLGAKATHHILDSELVDCPPSGTFRLPPETEYIIGHNVDFNWTVIGKPDVKRICTQALSRMLWPDLDSYSLGAMMYFVTDEVIARELLKNAHSALQDVRNCCVLLDRIFSEIKIDMNETMDKIWEISERARGLKL
ncbi:MAG: 3'-5' exonuclease [Burkholderiales bacterium]|jgi:exodeoxyribonuclease X|nr:3'-5' exonuclease [Burkholderiales bacterium]